MTKIPAQRLVLKDLDTTVDCLSLEHFDLSPYIILKCRLIDEWRKFPFHYQAEGIKQSKRLAPLIQTKIDASEKIQVIG